MKEKTSRKEIWIFFILLIITLIVAYNRFYGVDNNNVEEQDINMSLNITDEVIIEEILAPKFDSAYYYESYNSLNVKDCGKYIRGEDNIGNYAEVNNCIIQSLDNCEDAKALIDLNSAKSRITSVLSVKGCEVTNHFRSSEPDLELVKSCSSINTNLAIQYACVGYI